jgi:hypothetical protein
MELQRILLTGLVLAFTAIASAPLAAHAEDAKPVNSIQLRAMDQMSPADQELVDRDKSSIAQGARFLEFDIEAGLWKYDRLVCPALPNHLLLRFTNDNGRGDVSVFTASLSRAVAGQVTIIPIERRGYALLQPASSNPLTIAKFNSILAEEHGNKALDLVAEGLCYAVLAGGHPLAASLPQTESGPQTPTPDDTVVHFADIGSLPKPMQWDVTFDRNGRVLTGAMDVPGPVGIRAVPASPEKSGKPVPDNPAATSQGRPVPETQLTSRPVPAN